MQIPPGECSPLPPLSILQGMYAAWQTNIQPNWVPNLHGRTLEEVEREAGRIKLGDHFTLKKQLNRCLHSWCVLSGQLNHWIKTHWNYSLQGCPYGPWVRPCWRHATNADNSTPNETTMEGGGAWRYCASRQLLGWAHWCNSSEQIPRDVIAQARQVGGFWDNPFWAC